MHTNLKALMGVVVLAAAACWAAPRSGLAGRSGSGTPNTREMSAAEWRRRQLAAADKSDIIMEQAEKMPGLLGRYVHMQVAYDADHDRAFQVIFGQYLSWYLTFIGDYDGAADAGAPTAFPTAQPAQDDAGPSPLAGNYTLKPAADVILDMAKSRKAVFFN